MFEIGTSEPLSNMSLTPCVSALGPADSENEKFIGESFFYWLLKFALLEL